MNIRYPIYEGVYRILTNIARMGGSRHRVFQGILQVPLQSRLPAGSGGDTFLHSQLFGFLKI